MKKLVCLLFLLMLVGCNKEKKTISEESREASETTSVTTKESKIKTETSDKAVDQAQTSTVASSTVSSKAAHKTTATSTKPESVANEMPYAVSPSMLGETYTFSFKGMNVPTSVTITQKDSVKTVSFYVKSLDKKNDDITTFTAEFINIPTKEIRVYSADKPGELAGVRTVKVNTEIKLKELVSAGSRKRSDLANDLYVFINKNGKLALATPNYAGNTPEEYRDVMLEVLQ